MKEATLLFVVKDGRILLIRGKTGINKGKWNGPGGKVEKGEDIEQAAIRETVEETGITPLDVTFLGSNEFYAGNEKAWLVHNFIARDFEGEMRETEEAMPQWFPVENLPFGEMWPDDRIWMPFLLQGKKFEGKFFFDDAYKKLLRHEIKETKA